MEMEGIESSFSGYVVTTNRTGPGFYIFVLAYTATALLLIAPLVSLSRNTEDNKLLEEDQNIDIDAVRSDDKETPIEGNRSVPADNRIAIEQHPPQASVQVTSKGPASSTAPSQSPTNISHRSRKSATGGRNRLGVLLRELDKVAAAEYPDNDPDFRSRLSGSVNQQGVRRRASQSKISTAQSSGLPSAATTSRLHVDGSKTLSSLVLDVGGRRWKHRRPIGRVDVIQNAISSNLSSISSKNFPNTPPAAKKRTQKGMSDVASFVLEEQGQEIPPHYMSRAVMFRRSRFPRPSRSRAGSSSAASERSIMSSIVDDISPNDAADANDPGRGNIFIHQEGDPGRSNANYTVDSDMKRGCLASSIGNLLDLTAPGEEMRRVVRSSLPLTLGAMSEALLRLVTAGFISGYLGTDSMIAYLLVGLFVRLTSEELSGAVIDAMSSFIQASSFSGDSNAAYLEGQYIQLGVILQLLLCIPLLSVWAVFMDPVVFWLVQSPSIAFIAEGYARVIVVNYLVLAVSRTCTVIFHICGHEHFETAIDFSSSTIQLISVACVLALAENANLTTVAYIEVIIGVAASVAKVTFPVMRGWMQPFRRGMLQNFALYENPSAFRQLVRATCPLFLGTILEYGEWEVLTVFLRHLGPAEVATWALLGAMWDVLEALTEGIGEAAAIQVAFLLAAVQPERAKQLSHTVIYLAVIQSLMVTSALYMGGKYFAVLFSSDPTIQHLTNDAIALVGLANFTMSFSQVSWSLTGAQGRFRLATSVVFVSRWLVTMPVALISIFALKLDLNAVAGSLVVGYATAACALTFIVLRSDWERLSRVMQGMNNPMPLADEMGDPFEDSDDDDDSSEGFGFGGGVGDTTSEQ